MVGDDSGSVIPGYTGTVHFVSCDPHAVLPADYMFTDDDGGTHTFTEPRLNAQDRRPAVGRGHRCSRRHDLGAHCRHGLNPAAASQLNIKCSGECHRWHALHHHRHGPGTRSNNSATGYLGTIHFTPSSDNKGEIAEGLHLHRRQTAACTSSPMGWPWRRRAPRSSPPRIQLTGYITGTTSVSVISKKGTAITGALAAQIDATTGGNTSRIVPPVLTASRQLGIADLAPLLRARREVNPTVVPLVEDIVLDGLFADLDGSLLPVSPGYRKRHLHWPSWFPRESNGQGGTSRSIIKADRPAWGGIPLQAVSRSPPPCHPL